MRLRRLLPHLHKPALTPGFLARGVELLAIASVSVGVAFYSWPAALIVCGLILLLLAQGIDYGPTAPSS